MQYQSHITYYSYLCIEEDKSDKILKNLEVPKMARIVLNMWKYRKEFLKVDK